jgi:hypothetical protein
MNRLRKFVEQGAYREKPGRTAYAFGPGNLPERAKAWSGTGHPRFAPPTS